MLKFLRSETNASLTMWGIIIGGLINLMLMFATQGQIGTADNNTVSGGFPLKVAISQTAPVYANGYSLFAQPSGETKTETVFYGTFGFWLDWLLWTFVVYQGARFTISYLDKKSSRSDLLVQK